MKKILAIMFAALAFTLAANAQPKAIGLRAGNGAVISWRPISAS